jgi:uncharacterized lipoprotein YehR (DUF1307 family)
MGNKGISVLLLLLMIVGLNACDKYESKITGKVNYIDVNGRKSYPAAGAIITKMSVEGDNLYSVVSVIADTNGEFLFEHTTKGSWQLSGKKVGIDSTLYTGSSEIFTTNGENQVEQILLLQPVIKDTSAE